MSGKKGTKGPISRTLAATKTTKLAEVQPKGPPPARKITWTPPKTIEYPNSVVIGAVAASATGVGGDLRLEFPLGAFHVGQAGNNLRVVAPADGVTWSEGSETATVAVTPAPRTILSQPAAAAVVLGTELTPELFDARPSAGTGTVVISQPAGKRAVTAGKQPVVLTLAAEGNHAAAPPVDREIDVILPKREISWNPPTVHVYDAPLDVLEKASATGEGGALTLEFPQGPLAVGQTGINLRIVAPGQAGAWDPGEETAVVTVTPAPRDLVYTAPRRPLKSGIQLEAATFKASSSAGDEIPVVTIPAGGRLLQTGDAVPVQLKLEAGNYEAAVESFTVKVEKGQPKLTLTSSAVSVARNTLVDASWLTVAITPPELAAAVIVTPAMGQPLDRVDQVFISAEFPGNDHFLPVSPVEVRLSVCANAREGAGADAMNDATAALATIQQKYKDDPRTAQLLQDWDNDVGNLKTQGQKIMNDIQCMTSEQLVKYMDAATKRRTPGKPSEDNTWKFPNGLQVRYKANGDAFNPRKHFCMEVPKIENSKGPQDVAFKVTLGGVPGPVGNDVFVPPGIMAGGGAAKADFVNGVISMTHPRVLAKRKQVVQWPLPEDSTVYINEDIDATVWTATAPLPVTYRIGRAVNEYKPGDKIVMAPGNVTLKAIAKSNDKYDEGIAERKVKLVRR